MIMNKWEYAYLLFGEEELDVVSCSELTRSRCQIQKLSLSNM